MSAIAKVIGVVLIVLGLVLGGFGGFIKFVEVPKALDEAAFPEDFDDHFVYGGYINKLNMTTGRTDRANFTVDRHIKTLERLDNGQLRMDENIRALLNGTTDVFLPDLAKHNTFNVDDKDLALYYVDNHEGYEMTYTDKDDVNWVFSIPVDKDKDYKIWSMNILNWSEAKYMGKETKGGVECYVFYGEEIDYEVPLSAAQKAALGSLGPASKMKLTLWEKAWVHPLTGTIVDYSKEIKQYLYLPDLPAVPEIKYPSDFNSTTGFTGGVTIFDPVTATFNTFDDILAVRSLEVVEANGYLLTTNESVEVTTSTGAPLPMLNSAFQVIFNASTGAHAGPGRTGQYLFPLTGALPQNHSIWDDGFGMELNAVYEGVDNTSFLPLIANIYHIQVVNGTYLAGGTADLDMYYYVEPQTGIVLDASKHMRNWRPQNARRLPLDTAMINKTMTLNTTIVSVDPMTQQPMTMTIYVKQVINCSGYTDATFAVAKIQETVSKYLPNGTLMAPPVVSKFGVDAVTMAYTDAPGWSDTTRTGVFTFPVGLLNETGGLPASFILYNSDLMISAPAMLGKQYTVSGLNVAEYVMKLSNIPLTWPQVSAALGKAVEIPGGSAYYGCTFVYTVDIFTGTLLNITRTMSINLVPPTYGWIYKNLDSTSSVKGAIGGKNVTITQHVLGTGLVLPVEDLALINITTTATYDNGTPFLPPSYAEFPINITSHEVLNATLQGTGTYWLFPKEPTTQMAYPMVLTLAGNKLFGVAAPAQTTSDNVTYVWTNHTVMPGALVNPALSAFILNTTMTYTWLVDIQTGAVLDAKVQLDFELPAAMGGGYSNNTFHATEGTRTLWAQANWLMGWALMGTHVPVLSTDIELYQLEQQTAVGKALYTTQLLLIADGTKPALDLDMAFNATTKEMMKAKATATKGMLAQLPQLMKAHAMKALLASKGNLVAYVYYKQVDEDVPAYTDIDGSVKYWGDFSKEKDDELKLMGETVPSILFALFVVLVVIGAIILVMTGKPPEKEEEEGSEEEEGEGEE